MGKTVLDSYNLSYGDIQRQLDYFNLKGKSEGLKKYDVEMMLKFEQALNNMRLNKTNEELTTNKTKVLTYKATKLNSNVINVIA